MDFNVSYSRGKFVANFSGQLVFGPGGAGGVAAELKVDQVVELIQFVRHALEESDFRFLEWVSEAAFEIISKITRLHISLGKTINWLAGCSEDEIREKWEQLSAEQSAVKEECKEILLTPHKLKLLTPFAKAIVLDNICLTYVFMPYSFSLDDDELQAAACMKLLESINSEREFIEVLRLMGVSGSKGNSAVLMSNFRRMFDQLLYLSPQKAKAREWLKACSGGFYLELE